MTSTAEIRPTPRTSRLLWILLAATCLGAVLSVLAVQWCRINGWTDPGQHVHMCYSDFALLFTERGLAAGHFPFLGDAPEGQAMEYPVLIGVVAGVLSWLVPGTGEGPERVLAFYDLNHALVVLCWLGTVLATAYSAGRRRSDAILVALAPGIVLTLSVNWDMWAVFLGALALLLWGRGRPGWAGVLIGLGAAMKLYPLFFFGAVLVLCVRSGRLRSAVTTLSAAAATWLAVNLPFMIAAFDQWALFYRFSSEREVSFSSMWLAFGWLGLDGEGFSLLSNGLFLLCCLGVAYLAWAAPTRPRMAQLCFLIVASFILLGKVYSPQFVMWLIPLVVLARPQVRGFVVWQAAEVFHWAAVWLMSAKITSGGEFGAGHHLIEAAYGLGIVLHMATVIYLMVQVVREILHPERDVVRRGAPDDAYDPLAGVLAGHGDTFALPGLGRPAELRLRW
ncbi:glycosyltransferase family 87 protein [Nesterenkonia sp. HG001]|uniref:glycosyltransferase family 87 protein n=1 Tax=Nesterenkonia sp. HG001 TaxID=2983207 RepID=UPI002AC7C4F6|nr:glycosyltransferase 87 family protein [Nesterenkonia sp. HG001]MDZ5077846.1 glycosyltransferase 87 family protein [Nesterenkonia sp. HG001]